MVSCPECEGALDIAEGEVEEGDTVACDECGSEFEVVTTNPLELSRVAKEEDEEEEEAKEEEQEEGD